jgi:6-pyruvoyltetrahydropterin/6-carboxytetrahydropterin synthase
LEREIKLHTEVVIDSAHWLVGYNGICNRLHGHSWRIRIWVKGDASQLDKTGILFDFTNVKLIKDIYDHRCLNDIEPFSKDTNPTAENIALEIYDKFAGIRGDLKYVVRVYETSIGKETWAQVGDWDEN